MNIAGILVRNLLEVFNERDEDRRLAVIQNLYSNNAVFYEQEESFRGYDAINRKVSRVLQTLPPDASFRPAGPMTQNHNLCRLQWTLNIEGGPVLAAGMDVAILAGEKSRVSTSSSTQAKTLKKPRLMA